jgi:RimJ/RimL family protein N-acetyltransferase
VEDGQVVGSVGMTVSESEQTGTIGYWCVPAHRGRGVVTRAVGLLCRYAFDELHLERLQLVADPDNQASQRVAEKAGFTREGVLRSHLRHPDGRRRDSVMFSLLPGELR